MGKERAIIGVDNVHYALLSTDTISGATWQAAVAMPGITEVSINPNGAISTLFADNGPSVVANSIGEVDVSLKLADLTPVERTALLGYTRIGGVTRYRGDDVSPYVAIGFRAKLSDGSSGYIWLHKGRFAEGQETFTTQGGNIEFQLPTIAGKFTVLSFNGEYKRTTRTDDPDYVAATGTNWFTNGPLGTTDTTPPTATFSPVNGVTGVAVATAPTVTFNEAIERSLATNGNFVLTNATTGAIISTTVTINTAGTVVTITPSANLAAATPFILSVSNNVRNLAGIAYAGGTSRFTTI
ncbi:MAG: major tail protein [Bacillota bacterium]